MMPFKLRSRPVILLAGVVVFAGVVAGLWILLLTAPAGSPAAEEPPPAAPVKWMEARQFFVEEWTELLGTTQPLTKHAARITAPIEGRVVSVLQGGDGTTLVEGQRIKKGDIIVQLDANLIAANRGKSEANQEELKQLTTQADVAMQQAEFEVKRLGVLRGNKEAYDKLPLVSQYELDKAKLALQDAESKLKAARLRELTGLKEIQALRHQEMLHTLTTPIDGRLGRLLVVQGQTLATGTLVAEVVDTDDWIDVLCFVPPVVAKRLATGQPARIGAVDEPPSGASNVEGKVAFIANQAEIDTGNFAVKLRFPNEHLGLRANMMLRVRVLTTPGKACLTLPESALLEDQDPPGVIVVDDYKVVKTKEGKDVETGTARKLRVKIGIRDRGLHLVEIISLEDPEKQWRGNLEEARFVFERARGLRNGDAIRLEVDED
jgi:RND family efflux transporter MFP subunit